MTAIIDHETGAPYAADDPARNYVVLDRFEPGSDETRVRSSHKTIEAARAAASRGACAVYASYGLHKGARVFRWEVQHVPDLAAVGDR